MQPIDFSRFTLKETYFDNHSLRHGIGHTYRVMVHVLKIGERVKLNHEIALAFCGAFIHDMARRHDGYCTRHGAWATRRKLPLFEQLFRAHDVDDAGMETIGLAVSNHSLHEEIDPAHPDYKTVALLKDADALDRIRICKGCLDPEYLRFPESHELIAFAEELFFKTDEMRIESFDHMLDIAGEIETQFGEKQP